MYDDDGETDGHASLIAAMIRDEGQCKSCMFLEGGSDMFKLTYPSLCSTSPSPANAHIDSSCLGTLSGLQGHFPVQELQTHQKTLVDSVWFGKAQPRRDPPIAVFDHLFIGSSLSARKDELEACGIRHVIRLGWVFETDFRYLRLI